MDGESQVNWWLGLQDGLAQLAALLESDEPKRLDACERLDLWQHLYAVRSRLPLVEWALTGMAPAPAAEPATSSAPTVWASDDQPEASSPSATDISTRRRASTTPVAARSVDSVLEEATGLRASR